MAHSLISALSGLSVSAGGIPSLNLPTIKVGSDSDSESSSDESDDSESDRTIKVESDSDNSSSEDSESDSSTDDEAAPSGLSQTKQARKMRRRRARRAEAKRAAQAAVAAERGDHKPSRASLHVPGRSARASSICSAAEAKVYVDL